MIPIPSVSRVSSLTPELFEMEGSNPLDAIIATVAERISCGARNAQTFAGPGFIETCIKSRKKKKAQTLI
ncbi:hypothetical protein [Solibacillus sp.]|uniref:hypothetical protein n=1 Tax=Solibacillus sp. TaxID=1909654 RepID=UPI0033158992